MKKDRQSNKIVLITGASSGIGKACALYLSGKGYKVYGTSRTEQHCSKQSHLLKMDVTKENEISAAISFILKTEQRIDVLINNAGMSLVGSVEDTTSAEAKQLFETNFFGSLNMLRCVLPIMRKQKGGLIINISSLGGVMGLPFQGLYSASKFALEGLSESLRMELKNTGVKVALIEPGDFCTPITQNRILNHHSQNGSAYKKSFTRALSIIEHDEKNGPHPVAIAKLVFRIINKKQITTRYIAGDSTQKLATVLKRILPAHLFEAILIKKYSL